MKEPKRKSFKLTDLKIVYSPNPRRTLPSSIGQLVVLSSGGPEMLVTDILEDGSLVCEWETDTGISSHPFLPACLKFVF